MKVHESGSFPAAVVGRRAEAADSQVRAAAGAVSGATRVSLSPRLAEVEAIRQMALAAPEVREDVVAAAREALANGTLGRGVDAGELAARILDDLGFAGG